jgi:6-phosphogluconolactonase (cycloisomerase 2 family)
MLDRRLFSAALGGVTIFPAMARAQNTLPFYSSTGPKLTRYVLDANAVTLTPAQTVMLPSNVQYAWPDPTRRFLYVAASNYIPGGPEAGGHYVQVFRVGDNGALSPHGPLVRLAKRPVHVTVDPSGRYFLAAYNLPSSVSVHRINADATIGAEIPQRSQLDTGIYAHQIRVSPSGRTVMLVSRGNDPRPDRAEDPGAIKVFAFADGQLSNLQSLASKGSGLGFGPRHLDFGARHCFVSLERQNAICVYGLSPDGKLSAEPLFIKNALLDPDAKAKYPGQTAGPIHVHPGGGFVYQTNRGSGMLDTNGQKLSNGGENNIVVWKIDPISGEPSRIQNADAHGFELRTFAITPDGKLLIAASQTPMLVRDGANITRVSAGLSLYRIGTDGKLRFMRKHDVDTSAGSHFWCGLLTMV